MYEQALAGLEPRLREERVMCRCEHLGSAARGGPIECVGNRHRGSLVQHGQLGLPATAHHRHHAVAFLKACGAVAETHHLPGQLETWNVGGRAWGSRIVALALDHVGPI